MRRLLAALAFAALVLSLAGGSPSSAATRAFPPVWPTSAAPAALLSTLSGGGDDFGSTVSLSADGATALVGGEGISNDQYIPAFGSASIFHAESADSWTSGSAPVATLEDGQTNDLFGLFVALSADGTTAFVWYEQSPGHGAVNVYHAASVSSWASATSPVATLSDAGGDLNGPLAASSDGTTLLVGNAIFHAASAGAWATTSTPTAILGNAGHTWQGYGVALSADGTTALINHDAVTNNPEVADLFHVGSESSWATTTTPTAALSFGNTVVQGSVCDTLSGDGTTAVVDTAVFHVASPGGWADSSSPMAVLNRPDGVDVGPYSTTSCAIAADATTVSVQYSGIPTTYVYRAASADAWTTTSTPDASLTSGAPESLGGSTVGGVSLSADGTTAIVTGNAEVFAFNVSSPSDWSGSLSAGAMLTTGVDNGRGLGYSVSLSADGTTALVGAPFRNGGAGAAFIFHVDSEGDWTTTQWSTATLVNGSNFADGAFGYSVALSADGTTAVVAAPREQGGTGAVYVFHATSETAWASSSVPVATLTVGGGEQQGSFGSSVSLSANGRTALVGAQGVDTHRGAAYVFHVDAETAWTSSSAPSATLTKANASPGDGVGTSVSLSRNGKLAVVGAPGVSKHVGAAYVFSAASQASWATAAPVATLAAAAKPAGHYFGDSVATSADGTTALIGARGFARESGAAYLFHVGSSASWASTVKPSARLTVGTPRPADSVGMAVTLSSDGKVALVTGAGGIGRPVYGWGGGVYVFTAPSETAWKASSKPAALWNDTYLGNSGRSLGWSTAISGDDTTALVGAYRGGGYGNGAASVYHAVSANAGPPAKLVFSLEPSGGAGGDPFTAWVSVEDASGNAVVAGDPATIKLSTTECATNPAPVFLGTAVFHCRLDHVSHPVYGVTFTATAPGLTPAVSDPVDIDP